MPIPPFLLDLGSVFTKAAGRQPASDKRWSITDEWRPVANGTVNI